MVEGAESGLLAVLPESVVTAWNRSMGELRLSNGAFLHCYGATEPDKLRGPQFTFTWCDELAAWQYPAAWDNLQLALRLGTHPQNFVTTTPRPTAFYRRVRTGPGVDRRVIPTYDNLDNLAPTFRAEILRQYEGSRMGRQELLAELLEDTPGALWSRDTIDKARAFALPDMRRIVVAIDPAGGAEETNDETGIVVCGIDLQGVLYVLADYSGHFTPHEWASRALGALREHQADRIVAEKNFGGDMVEATIRAIDKRAPVTMVTASRGKAQRAEPISTLYEQGRVMHGGIFAELEDQMTSWVPGITKDSPDRVDALVWALTELSSGGSAMHFLDQLANREATTVGMTPWSPQSPR